VRRRKTAALSTAQGFAGVQRLCGWFGWYTFFIGSLSRKPTASGKRSSANRQGECAAKGQGKNVARFHEVTPYVSASNCFAVGEL
jgi:hypothetical protein